MASFNGLSIRVKRKKQGHDAPLSNGDICLLIDGSPVVIGKYCDDDWGGPVVVDIFPAYRDQYHGILEKYPKEGVLCREEYLFWGLEKLTDLEKTFIKDRKKYPGCLTLDFESAVVEGKQLSSVSYRCWEEHIEEIIKKHPHQKATVYRTLDDFNVRV